MSEGWSHSTSCVCGYIHEITYHQNANSQTTKGDEEFIKINGHFTKSEEKYYGGDIQVSVTLIACPKCGTIKMS